MNIGYSYANPTYQPAMRMILNIIPGIKTTTIITTQDHLYNTGLIIRLSLPPACGMRQIDGYSGEITVTGPTTFTIPLDSSKFDTFYPAPFPVPSPLPLPKDNNCGLVLPVGQNSLLWDSTVHNING